MATEGVGDVFEEIDVTAFNKQTLQNLNATAHEQLHDDESERYGKPQ